jgi:enoyl-CoA hydratase
MLMSASMIDAQTALQFGLVNYVVPADQLIAKAKSILEVINTKAPLAVAQCIQAANAAYGNRPLDTSTAYSYLSGYDVEVSAFGECFATDDMKEGTSAFLEKRKANFTGK